MPNFSRSNKFNIHMDLDRSEKSSIYNMNEGRYILDFFGMYASCPLGFNHAAFKSASYQRELLAASHIKVTNCAISSDISLSFDKQFSEFAPSQFKYKYYCCTGSLAVESAIKTALEAYKKPNPKIITFPKSFHGGNAWGSFFTSREKPVDKVVGGYPRNYVVQCNENMESVMDANYHHNIAAVLIEPLRSTFGDIKFDREFLKELNSFCKSRNIPIIVDEIQTGMGATGTYWFYEQLPIDPDIVIFGKKAQLSGIMVTEKLSEIFNQDGCKLEVTWDATLFDMIMCKQIIKAYQKLDILDNVKKRANQLINGITNPRLKNLRNEGLLVGFDLDTESERDLFQEDCYKKGLLVNTAGSTTIRLRPNLAVNKSEISQALEIIN